MLAFCKRYCENKQMLDYITSFLLVTSCLRPCHIIPHHTGSYHPHVQLLLLHRWNISTSKAPAMTSQQYASTREISITVMTGCTTTELAVMQSTAFGVISIASAQQVSRQVLAGLPMIPFYCHAEADTRCRVMHISQEQQTIPARTAFV